MDIFAAYATDETKELEGVVIFLAKADPEKEGDKNVDPWIQVARSGNDAYSSMVTEMWTKLKQQQKVEKLTQAQMDIRGKNLMIEVMARTILMGFGNLEIKKDKVEPTHEGKLKVLRIKEFREMVAGHAADIELYRVAAVEEASGN